MDIDAMQIRLTALEGKVAALEARPGYSKTHEDRIRALEARESKPVEREPKIPEQTDAGAGPVDFG